GPAPAAPPKSLEERVSALEQAPGLGFLRGLTLGAGLATSFTANLNTPVSRVNRLRSFDPEADSVELDLLQLSAERPAEPVGFRVDLDFGKTAEILSAATLGPLDDTAGALDADPVEVQQGYLALAPARLSGLTLKVGKFNTLAGIEVVEPWNNFTFSRGIVFGLQPVTHTGVRATYAPGGPLSASLGVVNGWDSFSDNNRGKTLEAQLAFAPSGALSVALTGYYGAELDGRAGPKRTIGDLAVTLKPTAALTATLNYDAGYDEELGGVANAFWHGVSVTVHYDVTGRLGLTVRSEVAHDERGVKIVGFVPAGRSVTLASATATVAYKVAGPAELRLEYRHDESNRDGGFDGDAGTQTESSQDTIAAALLVRF
ncbi:MAG TPA: porin, partial [Thermodesulfobacteriota bacterium]|nr:porin [Thermodesulfobacteriota bacterium]